MHLVKHNQKRVPSAESLIPTRTTVIFVMDTGAVRKSYKKPTILGTMFMDHNIVHTWELWDK